MKTYKKVKKRFYWKKIYSDVKEWCDSCKTCQQSKTPRLKPAGQAKIFMATRPFELVAMDIVGPLPTTARGHKFVLVITDNFTKWVEAYPLISHTADNIATKFVMQYCFKCGLPNKVLTDQDKDFIRKLIKKVWRY